ncbi:FANCI solenoid 4-domain-containing protein [Zopfochytrium polystomum]|nr:FANCI solenoid 4-domain-containing protein [Zopfochytrium polystomum]
MEIASWADYVATKGGRIPDWAVVSQDLGSPEALAALLHSALDYLATPPTTTAAALQNETQGFLLQRLGDQRHFATAVVCFVHDRVRSGGGGLNSRVLELLPKAFTRVARLATTSDPLFASARMPGAAWRDLVVERLCSYKWERGVAIPLASALESACLPAAAMKWVVAALVRHLSSADAAHVAALLRQLLVLCKAQESLRLEILLGICRFFEQKHVTATLEDRKLEAASLLQLCFAMRQDHGLASDMLKWVKKTKGAKLSPFSLSLLFGISSITRFETPVREMLKSNLLMTIKDYDVRSHSAWLKEDFLAGTSFTSLVREIVEKSLNVDVIMSGLVAFAFYLLDTPSTYDRSEDGAEPRSLSDAGSRFLHMACTKFPDLSHHIAEQILSRILALAPHLPQLVTTLCGLFARFPRQCLARSEASLRRVLLDYHLLPEQSCAELIAAAAPLLLQRVVDGAAPSASSLGRTTSSSGGMFGDLAMCLRKGVFCKEVAVRRAAVSAIVSLLVLLGEGEAEEAAGAGSGETTAATQMDLIYVLRRCLSQQTEVREHLYRRLAKMVAERPSLGILAMEIISPHFLRYCEENAAVKAPVKLDDCFTGSVVTEPFGALFQCVVKLVLAVPESESELFPVNRSFLTKIAERLIACDPVDFDIDAKRDAEAEQDTMRAKVKMLVSVDYSLLEFLALAGPDNCRGLIVRLFLKSSQLLAVFVDKRKRRGEHQSGISIEGASALIQRLMLYLGDQDHVWGDLLKRIASELADLLRQRAKSCEEDRPDSLKQLTEVAVLIFAKIRDGSLAKRKPTMLALLDVFQCIVQVTKKEHGKLFDHEVFTQGRNKDKPIAAAIASFQEMVVKTIEDNKDATREASTFVQCILTTLQGATTGAELESAEHSPMALLHWSASVFSEFGPLDSTLARACLDLSFYVIRSRAVNEEEVELLSATTKRYYSAWVDFGGESQTPGSQENSTDSNMAPAAQYVNNYLGFALDEVTWAIGKIAAAAAADDADEDAVYAWRVKASERMAHVQRVLQEVMNTKMPMDAVDCALRIAVRMFSVMTAMVKNETWFKELTPQMTKTLELAAGIRSALVQIVIRIVQDEKENMQLDRVDKKGKKAGKAKKSGWEAKSMPLLTYNIEQFERHLIIFSKKVSPKVLKYVKRSTARDFRIDANGIEELSAETLDDEEDDDEDVLETGETGDAAGVADEEEEEDDDEAESEMSRKALLRGRNKRLRAAAARDDEDDDDDEDGGEETVGETIGETIGETFGETFGDDSGGTRGVAGGGDEEEEDDAEGDEDGEVVGPSQVAGDDEEDEDGEEEEEEEEGRRADEEEHSGDDDSEALL